MSHSHLLSNFQSILRLAVLQNTFAEDTSQAFATTAQRQRLHAVSSWGAVVLLGSSGEGGGLLITELTTSRFSKTRPFQECPLFSSCSIQSLSLFACNSFLLKVLP